MRRILGRIVHNWPLKLGAILLAPGYSNEVIHLFKAWDLKAASGEQDEDDPDPSPDRQLAVVCAPVSRPRGEVALRSPRLPSSPASVAVAVTLTAQPGTGVRLVEKTGRRCFAIELDPAWCDVIRDRYERLQTVGRC